MFQYEWSQYLSTKCYSFYTWLLNLLKTMHKLLYNSLQQSEVFYARIQMLPLILFFP